MQKAITVVQNIPSLASRKYSYIVHCKQLDVEVTYVY